MTYELTDGMIEKALEAGACDDVYDVTKGVTWDTLKDHPEAPYWAYWYSVSVIKGPWPEAEDVIRTKPKWAYFYARDILKGPWPEAEDVIRTDPCWGYMYAKGILKGPWPEAEGVIRTNKYWARDYERLVLKGQPWASDVLNKVG